MRTLILIVAFLSFNVSACDEVKEVDDCGNGSQFTWNPSSKSTTEQLNRFYNIEALIQKEYKKGDFSTTKILIKEYLTLADIYKNNWNYGNAIHYGNRILGLISYQEGDYDQAALYLLKAGKSPGSPQLDSFGPKLNLANLLLVKGKNKEVKEYLLSIKSFWDMDRGALDEWIEAINRGESPKLNRHSDFRMTFFEQVLFGFGVTWPILASILLFFIYKKKELSPWKFIPATIITGYITIFAGGLIFSTVMMSFVSTLSSSLITPFIYSLTALIQFILPLMAMFFLTKSNKLTKTKKRI